MRHLSRQRHIPKEGLQGCLALTSNSTAGSINLNYSAKAAITIPSANKPPALAETSGRHET